MSRYILYKSRKQSLSRIAAVDKVKYLLISTGLPILAFSAAIFVRSRVGLMHYIVLALTIFMIVIMIYAGIVNKNLEKLGEIDVTLKGIRKTIGGFETFFDYSQIKEIQIKDHISSIFFPQNRTGSKTYLVTIITRDSISEMFVISSQSDGKPAVNFMESLEYIQKYRNIKFNIKRV